MNSIRGKMLLGGLFAGLISLILAAVNIYSVNQGTEALANVYEHQVEPVSALQEMDRNLKEVRFRMAGVLLDQMPTEGSKIHLKEVRESIPKQWALFKDKTRQNVFTSEAREQIAKIDKQLGQLPVFLDKLSAAYGAEDKNTITAMLEDEWPVIQSGLLKPVAQLVTVQQASVKAAYENSRVAGKKLISLGLGVFAVSVLAMLVAISVISADIHRGVTSLKEILARVAQGDLSQSAQIKRKDELGEMANSLENALGQLRGIISGVKSMADQAAAATSDFSQNVGMVMSRGQGRNERINQVTMAMEEMAKSIGEIAAAAKDAADAVLQNRNCANNSNANMAKSMEISQKIVASTNSSAGLVAALSESIQKIGDITTVIKEIADQTNLLALNAAIEAARAGEQGRGFAVVADEVRKLAERTSSSTSEISGVIERIRNETVAAVDSMSEVKSEVEEGADYNRQAGESLQQIVVAASQVEERVNRIVGSTSAQNSATEAVTRNMEDISAMSRENSVNIQRMGDGAEQVSRIATDLQRLVSQFKV